MFEFEISLRTGFKSSMLTAVSVTSYYELHIEFKFEYIIFQIEYLHVISNYLCFICLFLFFVMLIIILNSLDLNLKH